MMAFRASLWPGDRSVIKSQKAQAVASSYAGRFRKTCQQVVDRKGGAADN